MKVKLFLGTADAKIKTLKMFIAIIIAVKAITYVPIVGLAFGFDSLSSNSYMIKIAMEACHKAGIPIVYLPWAIALTFGLVAILLTAVYLPWVNRNRDSIANTIKAIGPLFAWLFFLVALTTSALSTKDMAGMIEANATILGTKVTPTTTIITSIIIMWAFGLLALSPLKKEKLLTWLAIPSLLVGMSLWISFLTGISMTTPHADYLQFGKIAVASHGASPFTLISLFIALVMISGKVACGATGCELGQFLQSFFPKDGPLKPKIIMYGTLFAIGSVGVFGAYYVVKFHLTNGGMEAILIAINGLNSWITKNYLIMQPIMLGGATYSVTYGVKQNQNKITALTMLGVSTVGVFFINNTETIAPFYVSAVFGMMFVSSLVVGYKVTKWAYVGAAICALFLITLWI